PRGRLVAIPIATGVDRATWTELVPSGERIMRSIAQVGKQIVVHGFEDLQTKIWIFGRDGRLMHEITPDEPGTLSPASSRPTGGWDGVAPIVADAEEAGFSFPSASYTPAPRRLHVDLRSGAVQDVSEDPPLRLDDLQVTRRSCASSDGTPLAMMLVTRKQHD